MVQSFDILRNVGRFDNVDAGAQLPLNRLSVIYADNARGKTTLAAILRSLSSGRSYLISERSRLGASSAPRIVISTLSGTSTAFSNGNWSHILPEIVVFDDAFVAENVCSGTEISAAHRQNLHELIVGEQGMALAHALQSFVERIEEHNKALRELEQEIPAAIRGGLSVDAFCALGPNPDLQTSIEDAERRLAAAKSATQVAETDVFQTIYLPPIDSSALQGLLERSLSDLDEAAVSMVQAHFEKLGSTGEDWVADGIHFVDKLAANGIEECPFCAQSLATSPLLHHYRAFFGESYATLKNAVSEAITEFQHQHSGDVPAAFERRVRQAVESAAFWTTFAKVPVIEIDTAVMARKWKAAREMVEVLLAAKRAAPLEALRIPPDAHAAIDAHNAECKKISELSERLQETNYLLTIVKEQAQEGNVATLTSDLAHLRANEVRLTPEIDRACSAYLEEKTKKIETERRRTDARATLDHHRETAFPAYGLAINEFLQRFNASFRVGPVDPANTRGGSVANYTLLIDGHTVPLSAEVGRPSFKNTLSAGDRNTLALAFFFASLQNAPNRHQKIVVIDDPMTSLDEHRTLHTLQEMDRLARDVAQMIVMSHSKAFLLGLWERCRQLQKSALEIRREAQGSTLAPWDVNAAMLTEHDRRFAIVTSYIQASDPTTERRVAEALRPMLEAFCRVGFPSHFTPGTMLGGFHNLCAQRAGTHREILNGTDTAELRAILDYANRFHHDTNSAYATELINDTELVDFARRTVDFIGRR